MSDLPATPWRTTVTRRLAVAAMTLLVWSVAIEGRLVYLQVFQHQELKGRAARQQSRTVEAPAKRGDLLDRNGNVLALSVDAESIYAVPIDIHQPDRLVEALCGALKDCAKGERAGLVDRIGKSRRQFMYVRRQVPPDEVARVKALQLEGIGFIKESRRFYPNREMAAHLLGYVGLDSAGLSGLESTYDQIIKGHSGTVLVQTDAKRRPYSRVERPPTAGASIELTIDEYLQHIVERELREGVERAGALGGSAIIMDPYSGEILALANAPTFNPNVFRDSEPTARRNRAVQDLYEPGSTFKIVTASGLLEDGLVRASDLFDVSQGSIRFGSRVIRDTHRSGVLSFEEIIVESSNVGTIKAVQRFGDDRAARLSSWVRKFGFGYRSSPDFPSENAGIVWDPSRLNDSALASVAIGYQVAVTPLQMAAAASAVANGGELVQPRVVRAVIRGGSRTVVPRKVIRRAISQGTAVELTRIMEGVVTNGTGKAAMIPGYTVAGKTGTASKVVKGGYSRSDYNVSFVGFVPSRKPVFTIIVVVDTPRLLPKYGGTVSAPIFQRIADAALRQYGVPPSINAAPPVLVARAPSPPVSPASVRANPTLIPVTAARGPAVCPDLVGMSARDAVLALTRLGVTARVRGDGPVVAQQPAAGFVIEPGMTATLWLERQRPVAMARAAQR